jgi:hypothetical protein
MRSLPATLLVATVVFSGCVAEDTASTSETQAMTEMDFPDGKDVDEAYSDDFASAFAAAGERFGVEIVWGFGELYEEYNGGLREAKQPADWEIALYAPVLLEEMSLYPDDILQKSGVKKVVICRDLVVTTDGLPQHISGHLDYEREALYPATDYTYKVNNRAKQRRVLHHALYHMIDNGMGDVPEDDEWRSLLDEGFEYGQFGEAGHTDRTSKTGLLTTEYPGFLNKYSTGHIADDKADIFAYLMVAHHYVMARAAEDEQIARKVTMIKERMKEFSPEMDEEFWERIDAIRRDVAPYMTL